MAIPGKLSGIQKTAVLLLALGDNFTADVFKRLDKTEITQISRAMLEMESVPKEKAEQVLKEFNQSLMLGKEMLLGGPVQVICHGCSGHGNRGHPLQRTGQRKP